MSNPGRIYAALADSETWDIVSKHGIPNGLLTKLHDHGMELKIERVDFDTRLRIRLRKYFQEKKVPRRNRLFLEAESISKNPDSAIHFPENETIPARVVNMDEITDTALLTEKIELMFLKLDDFLKDEPLRAKLTKHLEDPKEVDRMMNLFKQNEMELARIKREKEYTFKYEPI